MNTNSIKERIIEELERLGEEAKKEENAGDLDQAIRIFFEMVGLVKALSYMGYFYYVTSAFEVKEV